MVHRRGGGGKKRRKNVGVRGKGVKKDLNVPASVSCGFKAEETTLMEELVF